MNLAYKNTTNFTDKKVSKKQAMAILAKSDIKVSESEAEIILNFLYIAAKIHINSQDQTQSEELLEEMEPLDTYYDD
jgi:hypothetical protein